MSQAIHKSPTRRSFLKKTATATAVAAFASGIIPIFPSSVEAQERVGAWFDDIYRLFHVDYEFGNYKEKNVPIFIVRKSRKSYHAAQGRIFSDQSRFFLNFTDGTFFRRFTKF